MSSMGLCGRRNASTANNSTWKEADQLAQFASEVEPALEILDALEVYSSLYVHTKSLTNGQLQGIPRQKKKKTT